jgi:GTPase SAR1 family protein
MAVQIYPAKQIARQVRLKALIYGPAGAGKTHLITTLPKPILVLDFEGGVTTLIINTDQCDIVPIASEQDLRDVIAMLRESERYASVAFDGLSLFVRRRASELRQSKERLTWEDWQKLTSELRAVILPLVHLPVHLLLTCLPR